MMTISDTELTEYVSENKDRINDRLLRIKAIRGEGTLFLVSDHSSRVLLRPPKYKETQGAKYIEANLSKNGGFTIRLERVYIKQDDILRNRFCEFAIHSGAMREYRFNTNWSWCQKYLKKYHRGREGADRSFEEEFVELFASDIEYARGLKKRFLENLKLAELQRKNEKAMRMRNSKVAGSW